MIIRSITRAFFRCFNAGNLSNRSFVTLFTDPTRRGILINIKCGSHLKIRSSMSSSSPVLSEKEAKQVDNILTAKNDDHGGVIVEMTTEPIDASIFTSLLRASISHWRRQSNSMLENAVDILLQARRVDGKKGVWVKLPIELANLVEPAVKEGFYYHHAEPKYLMLVLWIPETVNTLPANATHRVGVGAFVMNGNNEVLVVQEKSGRFRGTGVWKFPTGVVDQGEDICDAAVREVKEETGVDTKFVEILAFRQSHKSFFEKSDLFFVCMLQPVSFNIQVQELEIEAAQWMPFKEYAAQPFIKKHELLKYVADMCWAKEEGKYSGFSAVPTGSAFSAEKSYLYLNKQGLNHL